MSPRPPPRGQITEFGYRRITVRGIRKQRMEHRLVWEAHHGPVPRGYELHHVNGDKLDNRIENLRMVTRLEHKRIHSGCELRDGVWWKRCPKCSEEKAEGDYYTYPGKGISHACKACMVRIAVENKRRRRARKIAPQTPHSETAPAGAEAGGNG